MKCRGVGIFLDARIDQLIQAMAIFSQPIGLAWDQVIDQQLQDVQIVSGVIWPS